MVFNALKRFSFTSFINAFVGTKIAYLIVRLLTQERTNEESSSKDGFTASPVNPLRRESP